MKKLILNRLKKVISVILVILTTMLLSTISFEVSAADPKVSIIIPVYNTPQNLLRDCLESAKNQTLKEIEIICVDDGSTDDSGKILDEYANSDPRFVVVHQENGGTGVARDKGMDLAKGEYVQFLDHDDIIDPTMSEKCYNAAKEYDADIVKINAMGVTSKCEKFYEVIPKFESYRDAIYICVWDGIYKKSYLDRYNIRFTGMVPYHEDRMFNLMTIMQGHRLVFLNQKLYRYVDHSGNYCKVVEKNKKSRFCLNHNLLCLYKWIKNEHPDCFEYTAFFVKSALNLGVDLVGLQSIDSELLQDNIINQLPIREKVQLKMMMLRANQQAKQQKTIQDGIYTISSKLDPNMCLDISGGSKNDKANLQLWGKNGTNAQKFKVQYNSDGYYTIKAMCSGKFIDVSASGKQNGANIWQYSGNGTDAQKWFIVPDGEGYYSLLPKCNNLCMDVCGAEAINGANIHCWYTHGGDNQRFKLEKCEDKSSSSKPNKAQKTAGKPRPKKPVKIRKKAYKPSETKKDAGKPSSSKPIDSKKSA